MSYFGAQISSVANGGQINGANPTAFPQNMTALSVNAKKWLEVIGQPGDDQVFNPEDNKAISYKQLADHYNNSQPKLIFNIMQTSALGNTDTWHFKFAPLTAVQGMTMQVNITEIHPYVATFVSEGAPYQIVTSSSSTRFTTMNRTALGLEDSVATINQPDYQRILAAKVRAVSNGFVGLARITIGVKICESQSYYQKKFFDSNTIGVASLTAAAQQQVDAFGALNVNAKQIIAMNHEVKQIMTNNDVVPDMLVLPQGLLGQVANTIYMTTASKVGTDVPIVLKEGAKYIQSLLLDLTVYEDVPISARNSDVVNRTDFSEIAELGEWNVISDEDVDLDCDSSCADKQMSIEIYDHSKNTWAVISLAQIIKHNLDLRWDRDGNVSDMHTEAIKSLDRIRKKNNMTKLGPFVDPFLYFVGNSASRESSSLEKDFLVISHWGDADPYFLSQNKIHQMSKQIHQKMIQFQEITEQDVENIVELKRIANELSIPDDKVSSEKMKVLQAAITLGNLPEESNNNYITNNGTLKKNMFGVPNLPKTAVVKKESDNQEIEVIFTTDKEILVNANSSYISYTPTSSEIPPEYGVMDSITLPDAPFGYSTLHGLRYLANLSSSNVPSTMRTWFDENRNALKSGIVSFDKYANAIESYIPLSPFSDISNLPSVFKTDNVKFNKAALYWIGLIDRPYTPILFKRPNIAEKMVLFEETSTTAQRTQSSFSNQFVDTGLVLDNEILKSAPDGIVKAGTPFEVEKLTKDARGATNISNNLKKRLEEAQKMVGTSSPHFWLIKLLILAKVHKRNVESLVSKNVVPWFSSFILARPFERFQTQSVLWAKSQSAVLGYNFGQQMMTMSMQTDKWDAKMVLFQGCAILRESGIFLQRFAYITGYVGGRDLIPFTDPATDILTIRPELSPSMFVFNVGGEFKTHSIPELWSLSGSWDPRDLPYAQISEVLKAKAKNSLQVPIAYYIHMFEFDKINEHFPFVRDPFTFQIVRNNPRRNLFVWKGPQNNWNSATRSHSRRIRGVGHLGKFGNDPMLNMRDICKGKVADIAT